MDKPVDVDTLLLDADRIIAEGEVEAADPLLAACAAAEILPALAAALRATREQVQRVEAERDGLLREMVHLRSAVDRADDYHGKTVRCIGAALGIDPTLKPDDFVAACAALAAVARRNKS